jgi:hypothetical protein
MTGYLSESFHDLLAGESEAISRLGSSGGSHHPSQKCSMVGVPKGRVKHAHSKETPPSGLNDGVGVPKGHVKHAHSKETPPSGPNDGARKRNQAPLPVRLEQLWEQQKELEEMCLQLE